MRWVQPEHGSGRVDAAGQIIAGRKRPTDSMSLDEALSIAGNWRSSHAYPLQQFVNTLRRKARSINPDAVVVQRMKRMPSVISKLQRFERMKLSQMEDLGGGRAILGSLDEVRQLVEVCEHTPFKNAKLHRKRDYIKKPKEDGYRGVHLIYEYQTAADCWQTAYNGNRIEIQIRSQIQNRWATAVEVVDTFTHQSLKLGAGSPSWQRFFVLVGSIMSAWDYSASKHKMDPPPRPENPKEFRIEFDSLLKELNVERLLQTFVLTTQTLQDDENWGLLVNKFLIVLLDSDKLEVEARRFDTNVEASKRYIEMEKQYLNQPSVQLLLVSGESLSSLKKAYPDYFRNTAEFIGFVSKIREYLAECSSKDQRR